MSESNGIVLTNAQIQQIQTIDDDYEKLVAKSHFDNDWETDYQAALRAPAAFMLQNITNFEATFDRIIFHLDESIKKANDKEINRALSRTADDMFSKMIYIIQNHIELIKSEHERGIFEKVTNSVSNIIQTVASPSAYFKAGTPASSIALSIAPEVGNLFKDFLTYFNQKLQIEKDINIFYNQLAHVYQKILDSECYNPEYGLIRNTFSRNKEDIIRYVVYQKGLTAGMNLMKFDKTESEKQDTVRIISNALTEKCDFDTTVRFLNELKAQSYSNYIDIETGVINLFKEINKQKLLSGFKSILRSNLKSHEQKLIEKYAYEFTLKIHGKYDEYELKVRRNKLIKIISLITIIVVIGVCSFTFKSFEQVGYGILIGIFIISFYALPFFFYFKRRQKKLIQLLKN